MTRYMTIPLTNFANSLAEATQKIKCYYMHDNIKCKKFRVTYKDCESCLEYKNVRYDLIV